MGQSLRITSTTKKYVLEEIERLSQQHGDFTLDVVIGKQRSPVQNNSLHKFCEMLAQALNDAGLDMRTVIKPEVEIPWTKDSVKKHLWAKIQQAMTDKSSTREGTTVEYIQVYEVLMRHLGEKFGVYVEWPSKDRASNAKEAAGI